MSQENIDKFYERLEVAIKETAFSPSQDAKNEQLMQLHREIIEKKMGFSFDKTVRYCKLFLLLMPESNVMTVPILIINSNPKEALEKGYISERTFQLFDLGAKALGATIGQAQEEFLSIVMKCQNAHNGYCNEESLPAALIESGWAKVGEENSVMQARLLQETGVIGAWLMQEDGQGVNINFLLSSGGLGAYGEAQIGFKVNDKQVALSRQYTQILEEEKAALSQ